MRNKTDTFMKEALTLKTKRLILRQWREEDLEPFALLNADARVMEFFPAVLSREESDVLAGRIEKLIREKGWGFWAVESRDEGTFIGFTGLHQPEYDLPFNPCVEIGWRLAKKYWGRGYATEAGHAALNFAFDTLSLSEVCSFATRHNIKSQAVMERLGLKNTHSNFDHPHIPADSPLREHVLFKIDRQVWLHNKTQLSGRTP